MTGVCLSCLRPIQGDRRYHERCLRALFGMGRLPLVDVELGKLHTMALAMVGRTSLSGVQRKLSLGLDSKRMTLQVEVERRRYILKPPSEAFPALPENELVTMRLADLFDIEVPPCALVPLRDGPLAYLVARFDRPVTGGKLRQEDFCQLDEKSPKEKYDGSAELCVKVTRRFTAEPVLEVLKLFRLVLFGWWTGNGDMHLKNFSLLTASDGRPRLAPAYDLLCTRLVIRDDPLALPVGGRKEKLNRKTWEKFAEHCGLPLKMIARELARPRATLGKAVALIERSPLPNEMKRSYVELLNERARILGAGPELGADLKS